MKTKTRIAAGFTLVEIMIVVAIIGMLAAVAVPNFVEARNKVQIHTCISNLQQIDGAMQRWAAEERKDDRDAVAYEDIRTYMRNTPVCPAGGKTFADSYTLTTLDARPLCQRRPDKHTLPVN